MVEYFKQKYRPTKYKVSKTMKTLSQYVDIHPSIYDFDEIKMDNAEFIKQGFAKEVRWYLIVSFIPACVVAYYW